MHAPWFVVSLLLASFVLTALACDWHPTVTATTTITTASTSSLSLTWNQFSCGVAVPTRYLVNVVHKGKSLYVTETSTARVEFVDPILVPCTYYHVRVCAQGSICARSQTVATTCEAPVLLSMSVESPIASLSSASIRLSWESPEFNEALDHYRVRCTYGCEGHNTNEWNVIKPSLLIPHIDLLNDDYIFEVTSISNNSVPGFSKGSISEIKLSEYKSQIYDSLSLSHEALQARDWTIQSPRDNGDNSSSSSNSSDTSSSSFASSDSNSTTDASSYDSDSDNSTTTTTTADSTTSSATTGGNATTTTGGFTTDSSTTSASSSSDSDGTSTTSSSSNSTSSSDSDGTTSSNSTSSSDSDGTTTSSSSNSTSSSDSDNSTSPSSTTDFSTSSGSSSEYDSTTGYDATTTGGSSNSSSSESSDSGDSTTGSADTSGSSNSTTTGDLTSGSSSTSGNTSLSLTSGSTSIIFTTTGDASSTSGTTDASTTDSSTTDASTTDSSTTDASTTNSSSTTDSSTTSDGSTTTGGSSNVTSTTGDDSTTTGDDSTSTGDSDLTTSTTSSTFNPNATSTTGGDLTSTGGSTTNVSTSITSSTTGALSTGATLVYQVNLQMKVSGNASTVSTVLLTSFLAASLNVLPATITGVSVVASGVQDNDSRTRSLHTRSTGPPTSFICKATIGYSTTPPDQSTIQTSLNSSSSALSLYFTSINATLVEVNYSVSLLPVTTSTSTFVTETTKVNIDVALPLGIVIPSVVIMGAGGVFLIIKYRRNRSAAHRAQHWDMHNMYSGLSMVDYA